MIYTRPLISIVVPVYNVRKHLRQCLDSFLKQTYGEWEAILVDDASTDGSLSICKEYVAKDARFRLVCQPHNGGAAQARQTGIQAMQGTYCMFVDSDDWLEPEALQTAYDIMNRFQCSYVELNLRRVMDRHKWICRQGAQPVRGLIKQPELFDKYYISFFGCNILSVTLWGKLYNSTVIRENMPDTDITMGEDEYANLMMFPHLESIYISDYVGYNYRFGGMTSRYIPHLLPDLKKLYEIRRECIEKYNFIQGRRWLDIEMKNILKTELTQRALYNKQGGADLSLELDQPLWSDVISTLKKEKAKGVFATALIAKDADALLRHAEAYVKKTRCRRMIKRAISYILAHL